MNVCCLSALYKKNYYSHPERFSRGNLTGSKVGKHIEICVGVGFMTENLTCYRLPKEARFTDVKKKTYSRNPGVRIHWILEKTSPAVQLSGRNPHLILLKAKCARITPLQRSRTSRCPAREWHYRWSERPRWSGNWHHRMLFAFCASLQRPARENGNEDEGWRELNPHRRTHNSRLLSSSFPGREGRGWGWGRRDTAEIRFFAVRSPRFGVSGWCTKWRIQGSFHSSYSRLLNVKTSPRNSILSLDTFRYVR